MVIVIGYSLYILLSVIMTVWVGRTLYTNGAIFLEEAFSGDRERAGAVNRLLLVGFYLINFGFILLAVNASRSPGSAGALIEFVSHKLGVAMLVVGAMHFFNLYVLSRIRQWQRMASEPPPVEPSRFVAVTPPSPAPSPVAG
jgi:hypothetical protein